MWPVKGYTSEYQIHQQITVNQSGYRVCAETVVFHMSSQPAAATDLRYGLSMDSYSWIDQEFVSTALPTTSPNSKADRDQISLMKRLCLNTMP